MASPPVQQSIEKYGLSAVARAMDAPTSTVFAWKEKDKLPPWRVEQFQRAIEKLAKQQSEAA